MKKSKQLYISMSRTEKILGWLYMVFSLFVLPTLLNWVNGQLADPVPESTLNFVFYLTNFLSIAGIFHRFLRSSKRLFTLKASLYSGLQYGASQRPTANAA